MRQPPRNSQQQHCLWTGHRLAISRAAIRHIAWLFLAVALINISRTAADFADDIATASNYALADVASVNAKIIHNLLRYKWNATSVAVLQDALKAAAAQKGIYGAAAAFSLTAIKQYNITQAPLYSPYCHEPPATENAPLQDITCMDIGNLTAGGGYNYTDPKLSQTNWYTLFYKMPKPKAQMSGVYFDKGAGEIWMDTYSVPVMSDNGKTFLAVATADIRIPTDAARTNTTATSAATAIAEPHILLSLLLVAVACCTVLLFPSCAPGQ